MSIFARFDGGTNWGAVIARLMRLYLHDLLNLAEVSAADWQIGHERIICSTNLSKAIWGEVVGGFFASGRLKKIFRGYVGLNSSPSSPGH